MKKRFKRRTKFKIYLFRVIIFGVITIFSFGLIFHFFYNKININIDNTKYLNYLVQDALGSYELGDITSLNSTEFLLKYSLGLEKSANLIAKEVTSTNEEEASEELEVKEEPIGEENEPIKEPIIYLYNSHQTEGYKTNFLENFNINNTVLIASYILKEYLADLGIQAIVEENKVKDILNAHNWKYGSSYKASRLLLEDAKKNNPSLKYFIDLHRDAGETASKAITIADKNYARLLFVLGLENPNYEKNLKGIERLNELVKAENVSLTRGITKKQGKGVNGVYNQDFSEYTYLIEIGGENNTIEEINNTLKVLAKVLYKYIMEIENGEKEN